MWPRWRNILRKGEQRRNSYDDEKDEKTHYHTTKEEAVWIACRFRSVLQHVPVAPLFAYDCLTCSLRGQRSPSFLPWHPARGANGCVRVECRFDSAQVPPVPRGQSLGMQSQTAGIRPKPSATALGNIPCPALQESVEMLAGNQFLLAGELFSCGTPKHSNLSVRKWKSPICRWALAAYGLVGHQIIS